MSRLPASDAPPAGGLDEAVSVVVPCHNQARFLAERFRSILAQTHAAAEIVVVDDASSDDTAAWLAAQRPPVPLRVHRNSRRNGRPCAQWQTGIDLARHPWIWIAEADDTCEPAFLATLLAAARRDPPVGFVYCQSALVDEHGAGDETFRVFTDEIDTDHWAADHRAAGADEARRHLSLRNTIPNASACLVRRDAWLATGPFDASLRLCGDWLAYAQALRHTDIAFVAAPLNRFRAHGQSVRSATDAAAQLAEGYRVRAALAQQYGLSAGGRELAARFAATEWVRRCPEAAGPAGCAPPAGLVAAAGAFDPAALARLREPRLRALPRIELYRDEGAGFSEARRSSRLLAPGEWQTVQLAAGAGALRLDPLNMAGRIAIRRISLRDGGGHLLWKVEGAPGLAKLHARGDARVETAGGEFTLVAGGSDPQLFLPRSADAAGAIVEVELCVSLSDRSEYGGGGARDASERRE